MVVLRIIGDEWSWEDRIALAVPPQKMFTMCIPLLISKLGVEKWSGLVLYKTEGKPPKFCRATTPLDMSSNPQRERLRDGAVLWVRVAPSLIQQERDRAFQKALEEWRGKNGLKGASVDLSDVRRFMEELNSHLNTADAALVNSEEREERGAIEGEEHRLFFYMTVVTREEETLRREEAYQRRGLEDAYMSAAERHHRQHRQLLLRTYALELAAWEGKSRRLVQEEQWREFESMLGTLKDGLAALAKPSLEEGKQTRGEMQAHEESVEVSVDAAALLSLLRAELQSLLGHLEQVYNEKMEFFEKQREHTLRDNDNFLACLRQHISSLFCISRSEVRQSGSPLLSQPFKTMNMEELTEALKQQEALVTELTQRHRDVEAHTLSVLEEGVWRMTLDIVHVTQLNICKYIESLQNLMRTARSSWRGAEGRNTGTQEQVEFTQKTLKKGRHENPARTENSLDSVEVAYSAGERMHHWGTFQKSKSLGIHSDVYNILLMFVSRYAEFYNWSLHSGAEGGHDFLDDLIRNCGSLQVAVDELCSTCKVLPHPMRREFLHVVEAHAPHLAVVMDLMLHLYTGKEVELLLWIRPELNVCGEFAEHQADDGSVYYYHTIAGMSQWLRPASHCITH
ncbi:hypothetical protein TraAM80_00699 [Trypanosoma rangeli]|uniref:WW domain-containing protein n=1 Tax=Trypanosoma rangeli TaxID=5698 RepID=A0A3R7MVB4_TRYRA|nr:uncharacterized protein TraAM80_00699 [Trypanosoma rangeli]RNF11863.1 hypothetical protein TraAM80_00699 [Trypanosoma rangeli]|eukprot:RNF11863.1 hypothetical protein TraAM80_00699 [Trypanosoma rangeli]